MPVVVLSDPARMRLETISFCLMILLIVALVVKLIWTGLRTDFPNLPELNYRRSLGLVALWGLLFVIVLVIISGTRLLLALELWERPPESLTYRLRNPEQTVEPAEPVTAAERWEQRRTAFDRLRAELTRLRLADGDHWPDEDAISPTLWQLPNRPKHRYRYQPHLAERGERTIILREPDVYDGPVLVMRADGSIAALTQS